MTDIKLLDIVRFNKKFKSLQDRQTKLQLEYKDLEIMLLQKQKELIEVADHLRKLEEKAVIDVTQTTSYSNV